MNEGREEKVRMADEVDVSERGLAEEYGEEVFGALLRDHTTGRNIYPKRSS